MSVGGNVVTLAGSSSSSYGYSSSNVESSSPPAASPSSSRASVSSSYGASWTAPRSTSSPSSVRHNGVENPGPAPSAPVRRLGSSALPAPTATTKASPAITAPAVTRILVRLIGRRERRTLDGLTVGGSGDSERVRAVDGEDLEAGLVERRLVVGPRRVAGTTTHRVGHRATTAREARPPGQAVVLAIAWAIAHPARPAHPSVTCRVVELSGSWRALAADDELRRDGIGLDVDDSMWLSVDVPGHWRSSDALAKSDGPILYRRRFDLPTPEPGRRRWITFDGIFYQADVWLDGAYLGDPEGYFFPHSFDVTALSRLGDDHVLAVEVTCEPERGTTGRRNITGLFQHSEAVARDWNPGGIWRPVLVYDTGPVKLDRLRVLCRDADETRAHLRLHARLDSDVARRSPCRRRPTVPSSPRPSTRWRPASTRSTGRSTSTARSCGGRARSATSR